MWSRAARTSLIVSGCQFRGGAAGLLPFLLLYPPCPCEYTTESYPTVMKHSPQLGAWNLGTKDNGKGSATLGQEVSRSKRRPSAHCPGGPSWRISGNLGRGGKGPSSSFRGQGSCVPSEPWQLSLDLPSCPPEQLVSISNKARRSGRGLR